MTNILQEVPVEDLDRLKVLYASHPNAIDGVDPQAFVELISHKIYKDICADPQATDMERSKAPQGDGLRRWIDDESHYAHESLSGDYPRIRDNVRLTIVNLVVELIQKSVDQNPSQHWEEVQPLRRRVWDQGTVRREVRSDQSVVSEGLTPGGDFFMAVSRPGLPPDVAAGLTPRVVDILSRM